MAEIILLVAFVGVLLKKINNVRTVHVEWGLLRLEFGPEPKDAKRQPRSLKQPRQIRAAQTD
jgi:hypothetical protein